MLLTIAILVLFLIYLLLIPIIIVIDTVNNQYYVQMKGLLKANVLPDENEILKVRLKIFFLRFNFYPLKKRLSPNKSKKTKKNHGKKPKRNVDFKTVLRVIRSFKIKRFYLNTDSGNCITNAKLYPLFALLKYYKGGYNINFLGQNVLILAIENRPIRIIKSIINI